MIRLYRLLALIVIMLTSMMFTQGVSAQSVDTNQRVAAAKHSIMTLRELKTAGVITQAQLDAGTQFYVNQASQAAGHRLTLQEVLSAPDPAYGKTVQELTAIQRVAGLFTFINILYALAVILFVASLAYLFGSYVTELLLLLTSIPLVAYEVIFYLLSIAFLAWGLETSTASKPFIGFTGCLLFMAALSFTVVMRKTTFKSAQYWMILFIVWTPVALLYNSPLIGFIAVAALLAALGFSIVVTPLCYAIGFNDETSVGRATSAAFLILATFVVIKILNAAISPITVFQSGALFLGSFVGYLGLIIASSKWYDGKRDYILFQVVTIAAGIAALFIGSVFGINELLKIGETFFVLYMLEKLMEIPAHSMRGYATVGLVVSACLFIFCMFVINNPELARPYLLMP